MSATRGKTSSLVISLPSFIKKLQDVTAVEGQQVTLEAIVQGYPLPEIQWVKNGNILVNSRYIHIDRHGNRCQLTVKSVSSNDNGRYTCIASNKCGSVKTSALIDMKPSDCSNEENGCGEPGGLPRFILYPHDKTVEEGSQASFMFSASNFEKFTWYHFEQEVPESEKISYSVKEGVNIIQIKDTALEDKGRYTVVLENQRGTVSSQANLEVIESSYQFQAMKPCIVHPLTDMTKTESECCVLSCEVMGKPRPQIYWFKNNELVLKNSNIILSYDGSGCSCIIRNVRLENAGLYQCIAENRYGEAKSSCFLSVKEKKTEPVSIEELESQDLTNHQSNGQVYNHKSYNLIMAHMQVVETVESFVYTNGHFVNSLNGKDQDTSQQIDSAASIDTVPDSPCSEISSLDQEEEEESSEKVKPAVILKGPNNVTLSKGETCLLEVQFIGSPVPEVKWLKGGTVLHNGGRFQIEKNDNFSSLKFENVSSDDSGKYIVSVENVHNSDCHFASVSVEGPPDPPADKPTISLLNGTDVILSWYGSIFDGGTKITGYIVEKCVLPSEDWEQIEDSCQGVTFVVKNLVLQQKYKFRVRTKNQHWVSEPSLESEPIELGVEDDATDEEEFQPVEHRIVEVQDDSILKEKYEFHEDVIGRGRFGKVFKCTNKETGEIRAAKVVRCLRAKDKAKVYDEVSIMNKLDHPKLLQLIAAFEKKREATLIMEYISGGELFERVSADDFILTENECVMFMQQICEGVAYMHKNLILHLDLKPENILCKSRTSHQIKIIDFGLACNYDPSGQLRILFGTPEFVAPEVIAYDPIGFPCDMWSVGVICYVLVSGLSPFMGDTDAETFANITRSILEFDEDGFKNVSDNAKDCISKLLVQNPELRMSAEECLKHPWLQQKCYISEGVKLPTDKLKSFIVRRKWQKMGRAICALGRMSAFSSSRGSLPSPSGSFSNPSDDNESCKSEQN